MSSSRPTAHEVTLSILWPPFDRESLRNQKFSVMLWAEDRVRQTRARRLRQLKLLLEEFEERDTICSCQLRIDMTDRGLQMRPNSHNRAHLKRLLREDDDWHNHYAHLSKEHAQIALAARGIRLSEVANYSRYALRCALQAADDQRQIPFLRLPKEVRLLVYEHVVNDDPVGLARPPLLSANKQIREEASPIFFRLTPFRLDVYEASYLFDAPKFAPKTRKWLDIIGPDGIKEPRHISIASRDKEYNIDLSCPDAGQWSFTLRPEAYTLQPHHSRQKCTARRVKTLKAHLTDARRAVEGDVEDMTQLDEDTAYLKNLLKQKESAHECVQNEMDTFAALCGEGKSVEPTLDGIEILIDAITLKDQKMRDFVNAVLRGEV
ncbi:hypothetical protein KCU65_g9574, partial [Aureobasidium melanogenum]